MPSKIAVLGDGAWGTAIALILAERSDVRVVLWSARPENAQILREHRENMKLLPGVPIPESIELTEDISTAVTEAELWITAIPTVPLRATLKRIAEVCDSVPPVLSLTKGIEVETFKRPTQIIQEVLGAERLAVLSGPSHAEEVSRGYPSSVVVASEEHEIAKRIQEWFSTDRFRVYTSSDLLGVELGGALKNIMGLAGGICDGLRLGDNTKAALLTRGLVEMTRFGVALGAESQTFTGLAGLGDMIATCMSSHGRNREVGERLGRGESLDEILSTMTKVAEGVATTKSVHERANRMEIEMPITREVHGVLYEGESPLEAVSRLMQRAPRGEQMR